MDTREILQKIGFTKKEIEIYLYLNNKGPSTQNEIAGGTSMLRQTVYETIHQMEEKGLVSSTITGKRKVYSALDPDILLRRFEDMKNDLKDAVSALKDKKSLSKYKIHHESFLGLQGIKNLFKLALNSKTEQLWFAEYEIHKEIFQGAYWDNFALKRIDKNISLKLLIDKNPQLKNWKSSKKHLRETRVNSDIKDIKSSFVTFDDKTIIYSIEKDNLYGIFIQNKHMAEMYKQIFNVLWKYSKKI